MNANFLETARLLVQVAPLVFADKVFALKGGTAINLFVRDMPRLSVDLDLVFLDHTAERADALKQIGTALRNAMERIKAQGFSAHLKTTANVGDTKLYIRRGSNEVQVEVNFIMRGTVKPATSLSMLARARETLRADLTLPVLSVEELYAGKLVAAMDRQHPRDLFDVHQLYLNGGITAEIRRCFVVYLVCHNRPIHEVLFPGLRDLTYDYERGFVGLTTEPIALDVLLDVRQALTNELPRSLDENERLFLVSLARNRPEWGRLGIDHLEQLPGIRWKMRNIGQLAEKNPAKHAAQADRLEQLLDSRVG